MGQARNKWIARASTFLAKGGLGTLAGRGEAARFEKRAKLLRHVPAANVALRVEREALAGHVAPRTARQAGRRASR